MTDENLNTETSNEVVSDNAPTVAPSTSSTPESTPIAPPEKTLTQSEVNNLVGSVKRETAEKVRRDVVSEMQQVGQQPAPAPTTQTSTSDEHIRGLINQEAQKMAEMQTAQQVVNQFVQKMEDGKEHYEDFNETVEKLNLPTMPQVIHFANEMPNTADIMYELGKNPSKVASLMNVIQYTPQLANQEFKKLSDSIVTNKEAANAKKVKEPLSQVQTSYTGTDNGEMSVSDYMSKSFCK